MEEGAALSDASKARRTVAEISFDGVDITSSIRPYLLSLSYTDNEEDEADDLQIRLQDRDGLWRKSHLAAALDAAGAQALRIGCVLLRMNWNGDGADMALDCGEFELDSVDYSLSPAEINLKATALPYAAKVRQTRKTRAWESYTLSGIAMEMAVSNGMRCLYESALDPSYARVEQWDCSDISFLSELCHNAGISLKVGNNMIVLFDQQKYEAAPPVLAIQYGDKSYLRGKMSTGKADVQYNSCRVSYVDPASGKLIQAVALVPDDKTDEKKRQQLEISAKVHTAAEAKALAEKRLRLHNKFEKGADFTVPGNPAIVAGLTVMLVDFGPFDGKYMISQAKHSLGPSGYTVQMKLRRVLEGY